MAKEDKKTTSTKYKAVNPASFKETYNNNSPKYSELSKGESVVVNKGDKQIKTWLNNKIIIKE